MRPLYFFASIFALLAITVAEPKADPAPVANLFPIAEPADITGFLGDISNTLQALETLLQGTTLNNIVSIIDNAAALLTPTFVNETAALISAVSAVGFPALELRHSALTFPRFCQSSKL